MKKMIAAILVTLVALCTVAYIPALANADTQFQVLGIRARGLATNWGNDTAFGWVNVNARIVNDNGTTHQWAGVQALWSLDRPRLNCTTVPTANFTFVIYTARLINTTLIDVNASNYNLIISGTWNVNKITTSVYVNENGTLLNVTKTLEPLLVEASGVLRIAKGIQMNPLPLSFDLSIQGIPTLSGFIIFYHMEFRDIKLADLDDDGIVDLIDIIRIAKAYRAVPGMPAYAVEKDFNFNQQIDLGDLTTVAASIDA